MKPKTVNCLGVLVVDALSRPLSRYPVPGKVTQVITDSLEFMPGGGAANTSTALAQLGVPVRVFSKVGDDLTGAFVRQRLRSIGVDVSGICVSKKDRTPFTYVGIHPNGERTFIHTPGANRTFTLRNLDRNALLQADFLLYQDLWVLPGIDGEPGAALLADARKRGVVTLLDECWGLGPNRETWEMMVPHADVVLPSFDDMRAIYPGLNAKQIVRRLHGLGAGTVVLKMGAKGCLVSAGGTQTQVPSCATAVVDTTGAGDCFDAGFIAGLTHGLAPVQAARVASSTAAACLRHVGGAVGIPRYAMVTNAKQRRGSGGSQ